MLMIRFLMKGWNYCESVAFAAFSSSKAFEKAMDLELRKRGNISASQSRILGCLFFYKDGITQKEIADKLGIEAATLVPIIDRLEELQLLQRRPDPNDRRNNLIFATERAKQTWDDIVDCASHIRKIAEKGILAAELIATYKVLRAITRNLNEHLERVPSSSPMPPDVETLLNEFSTAKTKASIGQKRGI
jgi:DNA-binding MarR family transcriptional regulator